MKKQKDNEPEAAAEEDAIKAFGAETLFGDVRDVILSQVRTMEDPWSKLSEDAQMARIDNAARTAEFVVRQAVGLVAKAGFPHMPVLVKDFTVKGGLVKGKFETGVNDSSVLLLSENQEARAVLVLADPDRFMGEAAAAKPDADAPELPLDDAVGEELEEAA